MFSKIFNFGVVLPYTVYNLYKIIELDYSHRMHVISSLIT
jgi:hypothetical protein